MENNFRPEREKDITVRLLTLYDALKNMNQIRTQKEFCSLLGISEAFYTEIKKGRSGINKERLQNMAPELSEYKEWLLTGNNTPFASGRIEEFKTNKEKDLERIFSGNIPTPKHNEILRTNSGLVVVDERLWDEYKKALDFYENLDRQGRVDVDIPSEKKQYIIAENQQKTLDNLTKVISNQAESLKTRDKQIDSMLDTLNVKDKHTADLIALLQSQLKKSQVAENQSHVASQVVEEEE